MATDRMIGGVAGRRPGAPLPLTVLTGFLGAGKTSLLNRLLDDPALAETAVLINEIGEIALDHLLVRRVGDNIVMLASGCLCCTVRGDLVEALEGLLRDLDNGRVVFRRLMIETTGLADPAPVLHTIMLHPYLVMRLRLDGVVTVVDAVNGPDTLDRHPEAVKQVAVADRIVLSKSDLIDTPERRAASQRLLTRLLDLNPSAPILDVAGDEATAARLLDCGLYDPDRKHPDVRRWLAEEAVAAVERHVPDRHDDRIRTFSVATDAPIPASALEMFLDILRSMHGPDLLRLKGVVKLAETPDAPLVIHGVQHVLHPPTTLPAWPDADQRTRLVFIVRDIDPRRIRELFNAFFGVAAPDRADRSAVTENPLVPFGGADHR
jgi:G3E family GTPase